MNPSRHPLWQPIPRPMSSLSFSGRPKTPGTLALLQCNPPDIFTAESFRSNAGPRMRLRVALTIARGGWAKRTPDSPSSGVLGGDYAPTSNAARFNTRQIRAATYGYTQQRASSRISIDAPLEDQLCISPCTQQS